MNKKKKLTPRTKKITNYIYSNMKDKNDNEDNYEDYKKNLLELKNQLSDIINFDNEIEKEFIKNHEK